MTALKVDPDNLVRAIGGAAFERLLLPPPEPAISRKPRFAPFAKQLDPIKSTIAILTGSDAWARGNSPSNWFLGARLLLPYKEPPKAFKWTVKGKDCFFFGFGLPEKRERLLELSVLLIRSGATRVQWMGQWEYDTTGKVHLVDGDLYRLTANSAPLFKPKSA